MKPLVAAIVVAATVLGVVAPTVPLMLMLAVPVRLVTVPLAGVPSAPPLTNSVELAGIVVPLSVVVLLLPSVVNDPAPPVMLLAPTLMEPNPEAIDPPVRAPTVVRLDVTTELDMVVPVNKLALSGDEVLNASTH